MRRLVPVLILISIGVAALWGVAADGYFPMHDDTQVARVAEMGRALADGQFPVRMVAHLGYGFGYPLFNYYGPLPYYFGGLLYALGMPALAATKVMLAVGFLLPSLVTYWIVSGVLGRKAALLSSLAYFLSPYHAVQLYVRGAVGEFWVLIFWPMIFWGLARSGNDPAGRRAPFLAALGVAGAVLSHTLMGYVTVVAAVAALCGYWLYRTVAGRSDGKRFVRHAAAIVLGLGLSAFFWIPAAVEMGYSNVAGQVSATADYADHFVCVSQLWTSVWGFGGSANGCLDGMSFMIGKVHLIIALAALALLVTRKARAASLWGVTGAVLFGGGILLTTKYSEALWASIPGFPYLQYPWRFLSVVSFGISLLAAYLVTALPAKWRTALIGVFSAALLVMNMKWFTPQFTYGIDSASLEDPADIRWRVSRISDEYLSPAFVVPVSADETANSDTISGSPGFDVTVLTNTATEKRMVVESTSSADLRLDIAHFPGWRYFVENREVRPDMDRGRPVLRVGAGQTQITARFTDTRVRVVANIMTLATLVYCGVLLYEQQRKTKR